MTTQFRKTRFASAVALALTGAGIAQAQTSPSPVLTPPPVTPVSPGSDTPMDSTRPLTPPLQTPGLLEDRGGSSVDAMSPESSQAFTTLDVNVDGQLSRDEIKGDADATGKFKSLDSNQDGYVSMNEYAASGSTSTRARDRE